MEGTRTVGTRMCREKSTEEGSHEGNVKGGRAKLRPSPKSSFPTRHISPDLAPIVVQHRSLTTYRSLPDTALPDCPASNEEPVRCAVSRTISTDALGKARAGLAFLSKPGHRVAEKRSRI
jgi:hypothetical protein